MPQAAARLAVLPFKRIGGFFVRRCLREQADGEVMRHCEHGAADQ